MYVPTSFGLIVIGMIIMGLLAYRVLLKILQYSRGGYGYVQPVTTVPATSFENMQGNSKGTSFSASVLKLFMLIGLVYFLYYNYNSFNSNTDEKTEMSSMRINLSPNPNKQQDNPESKMRINVSPTGDSKQKSVPINSDVSRGIFFYKGDHFLQVGAFEKKHNAGKAIILNRNKFPKRNILIGTAEKEDNTIIYKVLIEFKTKKSTNEFKVANIRKGKLDNNSYHLAREEIDDFLISSAHYGT